MPIRLELAEAFGARLKREQRAQIGVWVCSGSPTVAEICAGSGVDWVLIDSEHAPNGLESILAQLHAVQGYPAATMVRMPHGDTNLIKQYLDLGIQNLLVPMVNTADAAEELVRAVRYPPRGVRGVGSALARASRWNRIEDYLHRSEDGISLFVQIETGEAVNNIDSILAVDGIAGVFVGPADLAASLGVLGQQHHPDVVAGVDRVIAAGLAARVPVGVNAFDPALAQRYIDGGIDFILVAADVSLLARSTEGLADRYMPVESRDSPSRSSY